MMLNYTAQFEVNTLSDLYTYRLLVEENKMNKPNFSKLARELNKSRNTVKKHYYGDNDKPVKRKPRTSKVEDCHHYIEYLLSDNLKKFEYIQHLYDYIIRKRYDNEPPFSYGSFRRYIQTHFSKAFKDNQNKVTGPRFETKPGQQIQFDMKESQIVYDENNTEYIADIACITAGFSRHTYRNLIPDKTRETLLDFLVRYFEYLGGVPKEIVIDNLKQFVDKGRNKGDNETLNVVFEEFCKDFNIKPITCIVRRACTKGKVEVQMKPIDAIHNYNGDYSGQEGLQDVITYLTDRYNCKKSQATGLPPALLLDKEKEHIQPLPPDQIRSKYKIVTKSYLVGNDSLFSFKSNKYSMPLEYKNKRVDVRITENQLQVYYNSKLICTHQISDKKINYLPEHHNQASLAVKIEPNYQQAMENFRQLENILYD